MTACASAPSMIPGPHPVLADSLRLDLPKNHPEPIHIRDDLDSSPHSEHDSPPLPPDGENAINVSISRTQTRLASPKTPSAEKAAVMKDLDGIFDDNIDDEETNNTHRGAAIAPAVVQEPQTPPTSPHILSPDLPSPWHAKAMAFERPPSKDQTEGLARYIPSFPSLPKISTFRESVPSLGSILGNVRSRSPVRKGSAARNRASTLANPKSNWSPPAQRGISADLTNSERRADGLGIFLEDKTRIPRPATPPRKPDTLRNKDRTLKVLHRSTSDQSLYLRTVTSTATSLGDDNRWAHVSEQVNSRAKAIKDSLQDSSFKRFSVTQMPSFSFRPEFLRSRAQSDTKLDFNAEPMASYTDHPFLDRPLPRKRPKQPASSEQKLPSQYPHLEEALANLTGDLVILGGYRGSVLRSAKPPHRQLWVPVKVGLNIRKVNLEVGLEPEDEERMEGTIYPDGMLSNIGPIDMGRRLLKKIRQCKNVREGKLRLQDYGYDWRLSPHLLGRKLMRFLQNLPSNRPRVTSRERGATVICHSMGGLLTRHAVNQRPDLFAGVIYVGVPQHCINILGPFRNGDQVLLSSNVLTAQTNFSMRSSFVLLPDDGHCFINKDTGEEYPVDFFNAAEWEKYAWSPCIATPDPPPMERSKPLLGSISGSLPSFPSLPIPGRKALETPNMSTERSTASSSPPPATKRAAAVEPQMSSPQDPASAAAPSIPITIQKRAALAYLKRTLAETRLFRSELSHNPAHSHANAYPPLALMYANNTPTVLAARVSSREAIKRADAYDDLKFGSGDGVVLAKAAQLPPGYRAVAGGKVKSERGHVGLLGDLDSVGRALEAVRKGRREGVGMGLADDGMK